MSSRYLAAYVASGASVEGRRLILATYSGLAPGAKSLRRVSRHDREVSPKRASVKSSMVRPSRGVYVPGAGREEPEKVAHVCFDLLGQSSLAGARANAIIIISHGYK